MKNLPYILNAILFVAIIVLYILFFSSKKTQENTAVVQFEGDSTATLPIAYVNIDSILTNYNYAKDMNDALMRKSESAKATLNQKQKNLIAEQQEFQRKYQNNAFIGGEERAKQEAQRIQKLGVDFEEMAGRLEQEFTMEQLKMNSQLADSVRNCIKEYNLQANYHIILSNSGLDNILYAKDKYDITNAIVTLLNSRYTPASK